MRYFTVRRIRPLNACEGGRYLRLRWPSWTCTKSWSRGWTRTDSSSGCSCCSRLRRSRRGTRSSAWMASCSPTATSGWRSTSASTCSSAATPSTRRCRSWAVCCPGCSRWRRFPATSRPSRAPASSVGTWSSSTRAGGGCSPTPGSTRSSAQRDRRRGGSRSYIYCRRGPPLNTKG